MNANKFRSNIQSLKDRVYDVLIIGGGITGANILWDSTLRGLKGLLVEKSDYASGTSQATSKLIHGGLRYLKNFELGLVRESLRERRILAKISPHAVETLGFFIPIYDMKTKFMLGAGMLMYDKLSYDKNKDISTDRLIPKYRSYSREEAIYEAPEISRARLRGAYLYYDYTNINPERHTTEFIFSAREQGAVARNYTQVIKIARLETGNFLVDLKDVLSGELISVESRTLVNSAGPWADYIEDMAGIKMDAKLVRSKGIHIVTRKISGNKCIVLQKRDGSHLFVIPWRNKTLIGTTDTSFNEEPDAMRVTKKEILDLIDEVNYSFGLAKLSIDDVDYFYGGLRPLVEDPGEKSDTYNASRKSEILDHKEKGLPGFFSALGGKYTTSRAVAENLVNHLTKYLGNTNVSCTTDRTPLISGRYNTLKELVDDLQKKFPEIEGEKLETIAKRYGSQAEKILKNSRRNVYSLANYEKIYEEEIEYICSNEDIVTARDFYLRRSGVGIPGLPVEEEHKKIMQKLATILSWDKAGLEEEDRVLRACYIPKET